ncbi:oxidoreductase [Photobacterium damselae]|uniref:oxidoreductase n=1 Tax=Photobacterium damselae TaxID=38293 RepID=UPI00370CA7CF
MKQEHQILFTPLKIGTLTLKNRYSMAPMGTLGCVDSDGAYNARGVEYYVARAKGGVGLIITGVQMVENELEQFPMPSLPCPSYNPTAYIRSARELTERVHSYGCKIFAQLTAGWGRSCIPGFTPNDKCIAPSKSANRFDPTLEHRELATQEVKHFITKFAESAAIAQKAGYDGVEIHAVHEGYLLDQFSLSFFNQRTDEYGGNFENRYRFAVEIVKAIKSVCGERFPVSLRYSVKSNMKGYGQGILPEEDAIEVGRDLEEGLRAAKYLQDAGYDALNVDAGTYDSWYWNHPANYFKPGMYQPYCKAVSEVVDIPVLMAGRMENPDLAAKAVQEGVADGISMGRPLLADPDVVNKIRSGKFEQVRPCLSCHQGCLGRMAEVGNISCAVNPACGREEEYKLTPCLTKKKIMIIGGGVAGMEAARVSALRGHEVHLFEATPYLGGNVIPGSQPPFKHDDKLLIKWFEGELQRQGVYVHLNAKVTQDMIQECNADVVIFATGSKPMVPAWLSGADQSHVSVAEDILMNPELITGQSVCVIGGGLVGSELALWLAQKDKDVTLIEAANDIIGGPHGTCFANYQMLKELLVKHKVDVKLSTKLRTITETGIEIEDQDSNISSIDYPHVVLALGYRAESSIYDQLANQLEVDEIYNIGDSQQARTIMAAIWEGYEVARQI